VTLGVLVSIELGRLLRLEQSLPGRDLSLGGIEDGGIKALDFF
jgi:hypothetical protein